MDDLVLTQCAHGTHGIDNMCTDAHGQCASFVLDAGDLDTRTCKSIEQMTTGQHNRHAEQPSTSAWTSHKFQHQDLPVVPPTPPKFNTGRCLLHQTAPHHTTFPCPMHTTSTPKNCTKYPMYSNFATTGSKYIYKEDTPHTQQFNNNRQGSV